jgi:hypothetical protein
MVLELVYKEKGVANCPSELEENKMEEFSSDQIHRSSDYSGRHV